MAKDTETVTFSEDERDLILDHTFIDGDLDSRFRLAVIEDGKLRLTFDPASLDDLLGHIAFQANHADDKALAKKLDRLYDRLQAIERRLGWQ